MIFDFKSLRRRSGTNRFVRLPLERLEDRIVPSSAQQSYLQLPLSFEANVGQTDAEVQYLARGQDYALYLTPTAAVLNLFQGDSSSVLRAQLVGGNPDAQATGVDALSGKANYFLGNDPSQWYTDVATFARVQYQDVYPGVNLVYYGTSQRQLEYDFVVAPGADPSVIQLNFQGADVSLDAQGNLVLHTSVGDVIQHAPVIYQETNGVRQEVHGAFVLSGGNVGFDIGAYNPALPLVIDPILVYSTYLGGNAMDDALDVAVDGVGVAYVTGFTRSANFPTGSAYDGSLGGSSDAFVAAFNPAGNTLIYSTYVGGSGRENDYTVNGGTASIALEGNQAWITGYTQSGNFPIAGSAVQSTLRGTQDAFLTGLNWAGNGLRYSSYLGGTGIDAGTGIAINSAVVLTGWTTSTDFPLQGALQATAGGGVDAFIARVSGSSLLFSTYLGGSGDDHALDLALDGSSNVIVTGRTLSSNFPTTPGMDSTLGGASDAFVTKLDSAGSSMTFSTLLGGSGDEDLELTQSLEVGGVGVDGSGNIYVTGSTASADFPIAAALDNVLGGTWDAFITKFGSTGAIVYSTYLGGTGNDFGTSIAVVTTGEAFVTGYTESSDFPTSIPTQAALAGSRDAFLSFINAGGIALTYSTYFGGSNGAQGDIARAIYFGTRNQVYIVGFTDASTFPTQSARQPAFGGGPGDGFVARFAPIPGITVSGGVSAVEGGATGGYYVILNSQPTANVYVTLTPDTQVTVSPAVLTFTPANWDTAITVTVTAVNDAILETTFYHSGTITQAATSADSNYNGVPLATITARITDNDSPGLYIWTPGGTSVSETGSTTRTYPVVLLSQPSADVYVTVTSDPQVTVSPAVLTFTPANWNVAQGETITAVDDGLIESSPHYGLITHTPTSADPNYNVTTYTTVNGAATNILSASITDNDTPGVNVWGGVGVYEEGPTTSTYYVNLRSVPSADVLIAITPDSQITTSASELTFTPLNWNVNQTVTVTAVDDSIPETIFYHLGLIAQSATSGDPNYNGIAVATVTCNVVDNDTPSINMWFGGINVSEAGPTTRNYRIQLTSPPTANVYITLTPDAQVSVAPAVLTFTSANWNAWQNINVTAIDDGFVEGNHTGILTHTVTSADPNYNGRVVPNVTANITDNDAYAITVTQSGGSSDVAEGGATDWYTVVLGSQPAGDLLITLAPNAQLSVSAPVLTFTAVNWSTSQTVVVTAVDDAVAEGPHTGSIVQTATSTDPNYNGRAMATITANITDNDTAGIILTESAASTDVTEGGATDSYTIVLTSEPTANVLVSLSPGVLVTVIPTPLTFTAGNWNVPQTVAVAAVNDNIMDGPRNAAIAHTVTSADPNYGGRSLAAVTAHITDNDFAGVAVTPSGGSTNLSENGAIDDYTVVLSSQPTANVIVTVSPDAQMTVSPGKLTFTPGNWNVPQAVVATAINDILYEGASTGIIAHAASSTDAIYNNIPLATVTTNITDNDAPPAILVTPTDGGPITALEGSSESYTVMLLTQPIADLFITLQPDAQLTTSPAVLTILAADWNIPHPVFAKAFDDIVAEGPHQGIIRHTITSADPSYNGFHITDVTVHIVDNDGWAVLGTAAADSIVVSPASDPTQIQVSVNGKISLLPANLPQLRIDGGAGNDQIQITAPNMPVMIEGGAGNDRVFLTGQVEANTFLVGDSYIGMNGYFVDLWTVENLILGGMKGNDTFIVQGVPRFSTQIKGNGGNDQMSGPNSANTWIMTGNNTGTLGRTISFNGIANLTGGSLADTFKLAPGKGITGLLDGGAGANTLDYTAASSPVAVNLQTNAATGTLGIRNIGNFLGGRGSDRLTAHDQANLWNLTALNAGTVGSVFFQGFENLVGGAGDDTFRLANNQGVRGKIDGGGGLNVLDYNSYLTKPVVVNLQSRTATNTGGFLNLGSFVGGAGGDTLVGANSINAWNLTGQGSGTLNGLAFAGFENLTGGNQADAFTLQAGADWLGLLNGSAGQDALYAYFGINQWTGLTNGTLNGRKFQNIETRR